MKKTIDLSEVSIKLKNLMKDEKLNYDQLSDLINIPRTTLYRFIKSNKLPKKHIHKVLKYIKIDDNEESPCNHTKKAHSGISNTYRILEDLREENVELKTKLSQSESMKRLKDGELSFLKKNSDDNKMQISLLKNDILNLTKELDSFKKTWFGLYKKTS